MQIALAWLLQRSSNILLIAGTSSVAHLRENVAAATMKLPSDTIAQLHGIVGGGSGASTHGKRLEFAPRHGQFILELHRSQE
jgi:diketogulonate reductase-like aldo/keto reductase